MREFVLEQSGAGLYRNSEEKIDPDKDFSHIDKRIQDVLGHYQKDFMGVVTTDNLGSKWGCYGSFLPVEWSSNLNHTKPQRQNNSRFPHNPTTEVRQNLTVQANEFIPVRPQPGIPPLSGKALLALDNAVNLRSSCSTVCKNQPKTVPANHSDNNLLKVQQKAGSGNVIDNSAIYSGLGLDISPSSSLGDSLLEGDGISLCMQELLEKSPSYIVKAMTSLPFPDGKLLSPLSDNLVFLMEKEINLEKNFPCLETSEKVEHESISLEGKLTLLKEGKVKQINKNKKFSEFERKKCEEPTSIIGPCLKTMEESERLKGREIILENPTSAIDVHFDKKGTSIIIRRKDERSKVGQFGDVGSELQNRSHVRQGTSFEQDDSLPSPVASSEEKGNPLGSSEKIQRDNNVSSIRRNDGRNDKLSRTGNIEKNSKKPKKSKENTIKKKVKEEFQDSFSFLDAGMQHDGMRREDVKKSTKEQRKMKNKMKVLPDSAFQEAGTYHERIIDRSMEKIDNDRFIVDEDVKDNKQRKFEDCDIFQEMIDLEGDTAQALKENSSERNMLQSQMGSNLPNLKEHVFSDGERKQRKSQDGSKLAAAIPKVSFKVGSSAVFNQQTDCRSKSLALVQGETQKAQSKVKNNSSDVAGKAILKKKEKVTATKGTVVGVAKRERDVLGIILKNKSAGKQSQDPSNAGPNPREILTNNSHLMEKVSTSGVLPTDISPALILESWVQCDKCQTWRLLPHNIKTEDLPKRWLCSMLTWLPGMNNCTVSEKETEDALRALYQLPPSVNYTQINQTYPNGVPPVAVAADTQPVGINNPTTGLDAVLGNGKKRPYMEVHANSKKDQQYTVESRNKDKLSQSRTGVDKPVMIEKKRGGSKDTHGVLKKVKRDPQQFAIDVDPVVPLETEFGNVGLNHDSFLSKVSKDPVMGNSDIPFKKFKGKTPKPINTNEDDTQDGSGKKRKLKDWRNDHVGTEISSCQVPLKESRHVLRKEKRQKNIASHFHKKESSSRANDKYHGGSQDHVSYGGSLEKAGRRVERPSEQHFDGLMPHKTVDSRKSSRSDPDLKMPDSAASTSSSSKVSSTFKVKVNSQAKCSPIGSISSTPLKVSRSDHDISRNQISGLNTDQELSLAKKKNLVARTVAPDSLPHHEERVDQKSNKETGPEAQFHPVREDDVKKISAVKHADEHRREKQSEFEAYECKQIATEIKEEVNSSCRKFASAEQGARSLNFMGLDKSNSKNIVSEGIKPKQYEAGSSRDNPSSSTQELELENSKGKLPKQPGYGKLVADDAGASGSTQNVNTDQAAKTALKEAKDLKHFADRLKISGSEPSTELFFQAALKFLHGASLLESGNTEGSRCGDMKSSEVYSSTAKLCHYCAHEFEKFNDMASAALAYKCMEVAYMRVVYADDVAASQDRDELQLVQTAVPQVESPSSSASDVDNVNYPTPNDAVKAMQSPAVHGNYVISAGSQPSFIRLLNFAQDVNLAMDAARKSQTAFAAARLILGEARNEEAISSIKSVLDFSFHDVDELLHRVRHCNRGS